MLSQELEGERNIRVNSINPGRMRTPMRAAAYPAEDPNTLPSPASVDGSFLVSVELRGHAKSTADISTRNESGGER